MGLTRTQVIDAVLKTIKDPNLTTEAIEWMDEVFDQIETKAFWRFLYASTTHQTVNNQNEVLFSDSEFPAAALANYSKGIQITSDQAPYMLTMQSKAAMDARTPETGAPTHFALEGGAIGSEKLWLFPTPVTGATTLPLLTINYYKQISRPSTGSDDLQVDLGIPRRFNAAIKEGMRAIGLMDVNESRAETRQDRFNEKLADLIIDNDDFFNTVESRFDRSSLLQKSMGISIQTQQRSSERRA